MRSPFIGDTSQKIISSSSVRPRTMRECRHESHRLFRSPAGVPPWILMRIAIAPARAHALRLPCSATDEQRGFGPLVRTWPVEQRDGMADSAIRLDAQIAKIRDPRIGEGRADLARALGSGMAR